MYVCIHIDTHTHLEVGYMGLCKHIYTSVIDPYQYETAFSQGNWKGAPLGLSAEEFLIGTS